MRSGRGERSHLRRRTGDWVLADVGPFQGVQLRDGQILAIREGEGGIRRITWQTIGKARVARRVTSVHRGFEPVLDLRWRRVDGALLPTGWTIRSWFHQDFGPEEMRLSRMRLSPPG